MTINKEIVRTPTEKEDEMLGELKIRECNSALACMIALIIGLIVSIAATIGAINRDVFELDTTSVVSWIVITFVFAAGVVVTIIDYIKVHKKMVDDSEWAVVDCIAEEIDDDYGNYTVTGSIENWDNHKIVLDIERSTLEKLFENKNFVLFVNDNKAYNAIGVSGKVELINSVKILEVSST